MDPRNRPAVIGSIVAGAAAFVILWWLGLPTLLAWMIGWSASAFAMYGIDKRQAGRRGWRVPENILHGLALIGGVIGAWAGRAWFRHKTQETAFTVVLIAASALWIAIAVLWLVF